MTAPLAYTAEGRGRYQRENREMDANITYIVTGCTGYVGNVLTKKLMQEGCKVVGLARSREKARRVFGGNAPELIFGDVRSESDVDALFRGEGPFVVVHTAAYISIGEGDAAEMFAVNVGGTKTVAEACLRHNAKLLHISSTEAFPRGYFPEEELSSYAPDPKRARKGYPRSKSAADALVLGMVRERGLDASLLIIAGVLGPGDFGNSHMTQVFCDYIEGRLPASVDAGYNDFDIRDLADVFPAVAERAKKGESYLFAHAPDKINDCLAVIGEMTGRRPVPTLPLWVAYVGLPFLFLGSKLSGKRPLYTAAALSSLKERTDFPIGKAQREFGFSPRPLRETVQDHVRFLIDEGMVRV